MRVAVCDDDFVFLEMMEKRLKKYECRVDKFSDAKSLSEETGSYDIAFLDIELSGGELGFDAVKHLKIRNENCIIVFFSNYSQYAIDGYEYGAFRYILKNEPEALIDKRIEETFNEFNRRHKILQGQYKGKAFAVGIDEIYYIEIFNHVLKIHTRRGEFELYRQIKDIYADLREFDFVHCHRSYVVNLKYVVGVKDGKKLILKAPEEVYIPIGSRFKDEVIRHYLNYAGGAK
ncbi:MAG: LytTR family DNA-binding domain-containing protein [Clostridia bacterium]|nr:LytTR family DNA-binding domain-containing protein [Clostridia bacterium]